MKSVRVATSIGDSHSTTGSAKRGRLLAKSRVSLRDVNCGKPLVFLQPTANLETSIAFSFSRFVFSLVGLLLVLSDIPRTGYYLRLDDFFQLVVPGTVMYYGPYVYPAYHLNVSEDGQKVMGFSGDQPVTSADVWAYKFDTLSVPPRVIAQHLDLSSFPRCIMYEGPCPSSSLSLSTTFTMLDELVTRVRDRYFPSMEALQPVTFVTRSNYVDRLHHFAIKLIWSHQRWRLHTVHHMRMGTRNSTTQTSLLCPVFEARTRAFTRSLSGGHPEAPLFCQLEVPWRTPHPERGSTSLVSIDGHIAARVNMLQRQYPDLELDLTILTTRLRLQTQSTRLLPRVAVDADNAEFTTVIRGQRCDELGGACETRFVDDYRYERAHCETDEESWRAVTRLLRATAQGYVWVRVLYLWWGCYLARAREPALACSSVGQRLYAAWTTFFRIPGQTIVYGSWLPIVFYSVAHYFDSVVIHVIGEFVWATMNGSFDFDVVKFVLVASVQMRNIWLIALLWRLLLLVYTRSVIPRRHRWQPADGILGVRGMLIGGTSWLTIFSFMRSLQFRDTNVLEIVEMPRYTQSRLLNVINPIESGFNLDLKTIAIALMLVTVTLGTLQTSLRLGFRSRINFFVCTSRFVPSSARILWPRSMLGLFWRVSLSKSRRASVIDRIFTFSRFQRVGPSRSAHSRNSASVQGSSRAIALEGVRCWHCQPLPWYLRWQGEQGCPVHEPMRPVDGRSAEAWALIRLTNIAFMTDPLVHVNLYVFGRPLYLFRRAPTSSGGSVEPDSGTVLFPLRLDKEEEKEEENVASSEVPRWELVATVDSSTVPWHALVNAG